MFPVMNQPRRLSPPPSQTSEDSDAVGAQVERILNGSPFAKADQLRRLLAYIVGEVGEGRGADLKEYNIAVGVLRKDSSFDPRTDPIVRVQARRLRAKLEHYYRNEGSNDPIIIELPRGTYAPLIRSRKAATPERRRSSPALIARNTISVSALSDLSTGTALGAVAEGVRAEIVQKLTRLPGVRIVDGLAATEGSTGSAALVIGGSMRASGDKLRVSLHLLDGPTSTFIWAESFDGSLADPFDTQERAADAVLKVLTAGLITDSGANPLQPVENLAARNFYLQGRYHLNQRTEEGLRRAVDFFGRAIAEDERYALAHSGLADAYSLLGHYGVLGPAEVWTKAATFAASAVLLDDRCAEAHTSLAHVRAAQDWDWDGADREFQRAISLEPRYATAHHWYAMSCLAPLGKLDDALDEMRTAQALDPVSSIVARDVAVIHFYRREFDAALEQCDHTVELNPHFAPAYVTLGLIQEQRKDFEESAAALQRALQLAPGSPKILTALARNLALAGDRDAAIEALSRVQRLSADRYLSPSDLAWVSFAIGDSESGYEQLARAFADRSFDILSVHVDPRFDLMREDTRFLRLAAQLSVPRNQESEVTFRPAP